GYAVRTRGGCSYKTMPPGRGELKPVPPGRDEHQLVRGAAGGLAHRASRRATLFAPGAGALTRLRRQRRGELIESDRGPWARRSPRGVAHPRQANPSRCNPGRDEHQLVRSAAGELAHRAIRRATLFAPGAGAPTKTITPGRGELKPVPPGKDEHQLVRDAAGELRAPALRCSHPGRVLLQDCDAQKEGYGAQKGRAYRHPTPER